MIGLVEQFAQPMKWQIARTNIIVEGISDETLLRHASDLHAAAYGRPILDADFGVIAAGVRDDGGVEGVNRCLTTMKQLAEYDRDATGALRHRFVGLFDYDKAGREAFGAASRIDRRIVPYEDIFLLRPVMPAFAPGTDRELAVTMANVHVAGMDWEIEDLCSSRIVESVKRLYPGAVADHQAAKGLNHRKFSKEGKFELRRRFCEAATIDDARGFIEFLETMRGYLNLDVSFIVT